MVTAKVSPKVSPKGNLGPEKQKGQSDDWPNCLIIHRYFGAPGAIRTPDPLVRSQVLYPAELRAHCVFEAVDYTEPMYLPQVISEFFDFREVAISVCD